MISTQYELSWEASCTWGRLLHVHRMSREAGLLTDRSPDGETEAVWGRGDPQQMGHEFSTPRSLGYPDLGTEARILFIASQGCLTRLEEKRRYPAHLARTRLKGHGVRSVCEELGIKYCGRRDDECKGCDAHRLVFCAKMWLHWALTDPVADEPELPW